jgi:Spy/CpxP family protein refolding chaperone
MWGNLSPDQQKQVTSMRLDLLKKQEALRAEIVRKKIEFAELAGSPNADERLMEKKRQEIWNLQDKMRNERRAMGSNVRALLTRDQRKQVGPYGPNTGMGFGRGPWWER